MRYLSLIFLTLLFIGCSDAPTAESTGTTQKNPGSTQYEGATDVNPLNDPTPLAEMITFDGIGAGAQLVSPYVLKGKAVGSWYSEGSFPVSIVDEDGNMIASSPGMAIGNWMQAGWVPYQSKLTWIAGPNTKAKLILTLDNPAGEGEGKIRSIEIPVILK